jgi:16S rRNA (adenine1518-N6/adenine1519-N6)-dimethyltransferase
VSDVSSFLRSHGIRLNTDLGQHFLIDQEVLRSILDASAIKPGEHIVEIGPGIGVLTVELLRSKAHVTAIELDGRMIPLLKEFVSCKLPATLRLRSGQADYQLRTIEGNALHVPLPTTPYKIVANIPYHITSPLLRHAFLESEIHPTSMTLLIQREVAEKICPPVRHGRAGDTEDRGLLTILVGLFGTPRIVRMVPPQCFLPPPAVDSAVLHVQSFEKPLADPATVEEVFRLVKIAFSQKRKMLSNTLGMFPEVAERLSRLQIDQKRRPQTLSVHEWIALARETRKHDA